MKPRLYHVVVINERAKRKVYLTATPVTHREGCIMLPKVKTANRYWAKFLRYQLEEVSEITCQPGK